MRVLNKTQMNFAYGMGAAIVIIGALMKIIHKDLDFPFTDFSITGNTMLTIGLVTEAIIFALSAFDAPEAGWDWSLVYPELIGKPGPGGPKSPKILMSDKLDDMIKKAQLDQSVVNGLTQSIKDFEASARAGANNAGELAKINKEFAENANKLTSQMESLANNLESLNSVYGGVLSAMNKK